MSVKYKKLRRIFFKPILAQKRWYIFKKHLLNWKRVNASVVINESLRFWSCYLIWAARKNIPRKISLSEMSSACNKDWMWRISSNNNNNNRRSFLYSQCELPSKRSDYACLYWLNTSWYTQYIKRCNMLKQPHSLGELHWSMTFYTWNSVNNRIDGDRCEYMTPTNIESNFEHESVFQLLRCMMPN